MAADQARLYIVDGTALQDEESVHRGHDWEQTGLDTVTEAMERRRAKRLVHQDDQAASAVAREFSGWTLRQLAGERHRLQQDLADGPVDVSRELAAASRQLDVLCTRRKVWEAVPSSSPSSGGGRGHQAAVLDAAISANEQRVDALRQKWAARRAFLEEHRAEVERLSLVRAAERAAELKVRTIAAVNPPLELLHAIGPRPGDYVAAQRWRNAAEEVAVYLDRFGVHGSGSEERVERVLGLRPSAPQAGLLYERAAAALEAASTEMSASPSAELGLE